MQRYVLRKSKRNWSFSNIAGLVRVHLHNDIDLIGSLSAPAWALLNYDQPPKNDPNQLCFLL